jgi:glyceraldehyde-3-phosphate dehydrogenase/erythrose-4-phosphate dehydrogenase
MKTVAINGLGRIGRAALKIFMERSDKELVAVN